MKNVLPECLKTTVKQRNGGIMVWGAFSSSVVAEIIRCDKDINAQEYINIIEKLLLPTIDNVFSFITRTDIIF